ncbi:MAG TPA: glycosyltransferase family 1 protein [Chloroflexota bacterium]|jgi:glycosyltransferase involved in cell wall biosynthesis|nr:glycosyltransferase family 1 protein [Chloroflexota bacterium]
MRKRILVDLTPLASGGQNGGAGLVALSLVREIGRLAPQWDLVLLTSHATHVELATLDSANVRRMCVADVALASPAVQSRPSLLRQVAQQSLALLPATARVQLKDTVFRLRRGRQHAALIDSLQADLLFCPLTVSQFWRPGLPLVATVYDLQHVAHPEFFSRDQRLNRDAHLRDVCERAEGIACLSDFVRQTLLDCFAPAAERVVTIHLGLLQDFHADTTPDLTDAVDALGLQRSAYLLYPANFWPHKNHRRLFEALRQFRNERPGLGLRLVCTGAPSDALGEVRACATELLGLSTVVFPGYLPAAGLQQLLDGCVAMIYPSLYEGFGLPIVEAMARGKPVLCSDVASLPEVAGDAATYFHPTTTDSISDAIKILFDEPATVAARVAHGRERASVFGDATTMTQSYIALIERVMHAQ